MINENKAAEIMMVQIAGRF